MFSHGARHLASRISVTSVGLASETNVPGHSRSRIRSTWRPGVDQSAMIGRLGREVDRDTAARQLPAPMPSITSRIDGRPWHRRALE
jgi:hypothetical protein